MDESKTIFFGYYNVYQTELKELKIDIYMFLVSDLNTGYAEIETSCYDGIGAMIIE
jgi:hypothetical protein